MKFNLILSCFVAILALVNPIQKVLIVTSLQERFSPTELRYISIKSTITAMLILIFFLYLGQVTFSYVFRVELYSFQITCGAVLMYMRRSFLKSRTICPKTASRSTFSPTCATSSKAS